MERREDGESPGHRQNDPAQKNRQVWPGEALIGNTASCTSSVYLIPLGDCDPDHLRVLAEAIEDLYELPVRTLENLGIPSYAHDPARNQYNSNLILKKLNEIALPDALRVLGVTNCDLFNPIFSFVFGEAQFKGKCAVVSTCRLHCPDDAKAGPKIYSITRRLEKEAIHELGHTFGLRHCRDPSCVMHFSTRLESADCKFPFFCGICHELVRWYMEQEMEHQRSSDSP